MPTCRPIGGPEPYGIKYWCLGNEMDGPWQIGHLDMHEYGNKAREAAKLMRWHDPSIETVLCGSSNDRMPTFPEWDRVALETCWEHVDYLSIHMYVSNQDEKDTPSYLASATRFEGFVDTMASTLRYVKAKTAASTMSTCRGTSGRSGTRVKHTAAGPRPRTLPRLVITSKTHW